MRRTDRVEAILSELSRQGALQVTELSDRLGVSEATMRRDLTLLERQHLLTRTHGGALAVDAGYDLPALRRRPQESDVFQAIARLAATRVPDGAHVVAFTGGAATTELSRRLPARSDLTVVTTALNIAVDTMNRQKARLIMVGGTTRPGSGELSGPWAEQMLAQLNIGTAFIAADAISSEGGLTTHDELQARTAALLVERAQRVIVLAPGAHVGPVALARIAPVSAVHELITDASATPTALAALQAEGVTIGLVDPHAGPK
jgi:DeoR family transcriptional regulator of aga operon